MNEASSFQLQNPLSSKKFFKKIIGNSLQVIFSSILLGLILLWGMIVLFLANHSISILENNPSTAIALFIFVVIGIIVLRIAIYAFYVHLYIERYYYDCSEQFVTIKKGVFSPVEIHVQYNKIQDVYVDQDILDRIMGLYDVHIASATTASSIEAHIDGVEADVAEKIKNFMLGKIQNSNIAPKTEAFPVTASTVGQTAQPIVSEKISSVNYPISGSWMVSSVISSLFRNFISALFIFLLFFRKSIFSSSWIAGILTVIGLYTFLFIVSVIRLSLWKSNYYFELMPDYILVKTGILSKRETHLPYRAVQDVSVYQPFFQRLFGLATLIIENAASNVVVRRNRSSSFSSKITIPGQPLDKAQRLNEIFNKIVAAQNSRNTGL